MLWVGIGVPKQEKWMARMRERLSVPVHGRRRAPRSTSTPAASRRRRRWMQERGLEWTYRIAQEPRRLLPRYLYYNPAFLSCSLAGQLARERAAPPLELARLSP